MVDVVIGGGGGVSLTTATDLTAVGPVFTGGTVSINNCGVDLGRVGTSTPAALGYEQLVASNGRVPQAIVTTPAANQVALEDRRFSVTGGQKVAYFRLLFGNWGLGSGGSENNGGADYTIYASIEIPTAPTPFVIATFSGGSQSAIVTNGVAVFTSDRIPASAFGLTTIPAGTQMFIKTRLLMGGSGASFPYRYYSGYTMGTGEAAYWSDGAGTNQALQSGALSLPTGGANAGGLSPLIGVAGAFTAAEVSVLLFGDSIVYGLNDTIGSGLSAANGGLFVRSMWGVSGRNVPWSMSAITGATAQNSASVVKRLALAKYCTHAIVDLGTNDIFNGRTTVQLLGNQQTIWAALKGATVQNVDQMLILARTTSTDSWATTVNQTLGTNFGNRATANTNISGNIGANGLGGIIDLNGTLQDQVVTTDWAVTGSANGYTNDGTHPFGTSLTAGPTVVAARVANYVPGTTSVVASTP